MTEVQSALLSPFTKFLKIPHYLWYAHTSKSSPLRWCHAWTSGILTSTQGSCPIVDEKVFPIGQGVDSDLFPVVTLKAKNQKLDFLHFGRFDPSKNLNEILTTCKELRENGYDVKFKQIGSPSNPRYESDAKLIQNEYSSQTWVSFSPSIKRSLIPQEMAKASIFIHAYRGSLDKTLVEATLQEVPVVSVNPEYIKIFGSWSGKSHPSLFQECNSFLMAEIDLIESEVKRRRQIALEGHTLKHWAGAVSRMYF